MASELIGQDVVAEYLGVTNQCITGWYKRGHTGMPPAIPVYHASGVTARVWRRSQLLAWGRWQVKHNGTAYRKTALRVRAEQVRPHVRQDVVLGLLPGAARVSSRRSGRRLQGGQLSERGAQPRQLRLLRPLLGCLLRVQLVPQAVVLDVRGGQIARADQ